MKSYWGWLLLAACGTDPKTIDLAIPGTQALVTEKVNGGAWKKLAGEFDGTANATTYAIEIGDEYELAVVCLRSGERDAGEFVAAEVLGTSDDPEITLGSWEPPNCMFNGSGGLDPTDEWLTITGMFDETMDISVGYGTQRHVTAGHTYTFSVTPGQHDLLAYSNTKLLIQHDLQFDADATLPPFNIANDGTPTLVATVDLTGDPDEGAPYIYETLITHNGSRLTWLDEDPQSALVVPVDSLGPGDVQDFTVAFYTPMGGRSLSARDPYRLGSATLLPRIASSTPHPGALGMTWTPIDEFYTTATIAATPTTGSWQSVTASRLWLERHGKNQLEFDLAIDGYDPSWTVTSGFNLSLIRWDPEFSAVTSSIPAEAM